MSVDAKLVYDEHRVAPIAGTRSRHPAIRYYKEASAVIKVDDDGATPKLADERRLIVAQNPSGRLSFAAAERPTGTRRTRPDRRHRRFARRRRLAPE